MDDVPDLSREHISSSISTFETTQQTWPRSLRAPCCDSDLSESGFQSKKGRLPPIQPLSVRSLTANERKDGIVQIDGSLIDRLLYEEESHELDFKEEQYRFIGATDDEKCEILKDLLAFANSWRRADAFILVGVREVRGGPSTVVGISEDIDEAQLQQFVNSKTQRPITFSYRLIPFHEQRVGVFHIPVQRRPLFLTRDYGRLKKEMVYLRRGTSTAIADPDEIAMMGSAAEMQLVRLPRPWLVIDDYSAGIDEDDFGQEHLWERVHIVNRGDAPAVSVVIPEVRLGRKFASLRSQLRTLGPGEAMDADQGSSYNS